MAVWSNPAKNVPANTGSGHLKLHRIQLMNRGWSGSNIVLKWKSTHQTKLQCNMYLPTNMIHSVIVSQQTKYEHNHSSNVYHPLVRRQKIMADESYHRIQNCWHKQEPPPGENWSSHNVTFVLFSQPLKNGCDLYVAKKKEIAS